MTRPGWSPAWDDWTLEQEAALRALAGARPVQEIAAILSERFGVPRTIPAVRIRAKRLDLSVFQKGWSMRDVERLFGVGHRAIFTWWVQPGLLIGRRIVQRGPYTAWWFDVPDLERFVRESGWAYDWRRMDARRLDSLRRPEGSRLVMLARVVHLADPWLTYEDLARYVGLALGNLDRWRRRGLVPHQRRMGAGGYGQIMVRARDFVAIRAAIREAQQEALDNARARFLAMRRGQTRVELTA